MKNYCLTLVALFLCINLSTSQDLILKTQAGLQTTSIDSYAPLISELNQYKVETEPINPFRFLRKSKAVQGVLFMDVDHKIFSTLIAEKANYLELNIPVDAKHNLEVELFRKKVLSNDFKIEYSSGKVDYTLADRAVFYFGHVKEHEESMVIMSVFEHEIKIFIKDQDGNYTIGKLKDSPEYVFYNEKNTVPEVARHCGFDDSTADITPQQEVPDPVSKSMMCPIRVYVEVDNESLANVGTAAETNTYVTNLFAQNVALYAANNIPMVLAGIKVWDTNDPYGNSNSNSTDVNVLFAIPGNQLNKFSSMFMQNSTNFTIGHLISVKGSFGTIVGLASLGILCDSPNGTNPFGYSQVFNSFNNYPTHS
ncbi:MAG: M12 family metallo-peptidase, partial [Saprospiraceae bacterium]